MAVLWLDFETRSRCDLKARGVYNYAQDASTDVLCANCHRIHTYENRHWHTKRRSGE